MMNIAIFASGGGSNADKLMAYFAESRVADVRLLVSNKAEAGALSHAKNWGIDTVVFPNSDWRENDDKIVRVLAEYQIDFIVLAGFLLHIPHAILSAFPGRIVNIHPSLLPNFGGKGMYGMHVHRAVVAAKSSESGITIHLVNEQYDDGEIIFQAKVNIAEDDSPEAVQQKVLSLEHAHFAPVIEDFIQKGRWK